MLNHAIERQECREQILSSTAEYLGLNIGYQPPHLFAVCPRVSYLTFLCLSLFSYKMEIIILMPHKICDH